MTSMAVRDELDSQESTGKPAAGAGVTLDQFEAFCGDIQQQPNFRPLMDKCADYYDGNQLDPEVMQMLRDRGMGELINNLIKPTVDAVLGMEAKTRTDWRVAADADEGQPVAEALSAKLHETERESRADRACSDAYAGEIKAGLAWVEVSRNSDPFKYPHRVVALHRREIYWDWRAREADTLDGRYLIRKRWFDADEVPLYFPGKKALIEAAGSGWQGTHYWLDKQVEGTNLAQFYEQELRSTVEEMEWRDLVRRRLCLHETWYRTLHRGHVLRFPDGRVVEMNLDNPVHAVAVAKGALRPEPALYSKWGMAIFLGPHKLVDTTPFAKRHCYVPFWGYREDMTGVPYGLIRSMLSPQDEVNARRQKMMWLLSARRLVADSDAIDKKVNSIEQVLDELNRPDAAVFLNAGRNNKNADAFRVESMGEMARQQFEVMLSAEDAIQKVAGIFNAMLGRDAKAESGIAMNTLVEQGATVLAEINDNYRFSRRQVGEMLVEQIVEDLAGQEVAVMAGEGAGRKKIFLNQPTVDQATGTRYLKNDVRRVPVKVALEDVPQTPAYRAQQFQLLTETVRAMPENIQAVLAPYMMEASDLPKRQAMADDVRKALGIQTKPVESMTDEEKVAYEEQQKSVMEIAELNKRAAQAEVALKEGQAKKASVEAEQIVAEMATTAGLGPDHPVIKAFQQQLAEITKAAEKQIAELQKALEQARKGLNDSQQQLADRSMQMNADVETKRRSEETRQRGEETKRDAAVEVARIEQASAEAMQQLAENLAKAVEGIKDQVAAMGEDLGTRIEAVAEAGEKERTTADAERKARKETASTEKKEPAAPAAPQVVVVGAEALKPAVDALTDAAQALKDRAQPGPRVIEVHVNGKSYKAEVQGAKPKKAE